MTSDRTNIRRKTGDERRSLILNEIDATRGWVLAESAKHLAAVWPMSKPCEFEFVPRKLTVRDSVAQIGNYTSKSEVLIQSRTALNVGELENLATDQIGSITAKRTLRYARNFWVPEQVQDEMLVSRGKRSAPIFATIRRTKPIVASVPQYWKKRKIRLPQAMDPTLLDEGNKLWACTHRQICRRGTNVHWFLVWTRSGFDLCRWRGLDGCTEAIVVFRFLFRNRNRNRKRNRNRQLSVIANIKTDAQTKWNQGTVDKFEALLTMNGSWRQSAKQGQCKSNNKQYEIL